MSGVLGSLRQGADKAAFEAKRFARIQAEQMKLNGLIAQKRDQMERLGEAAWALYEQGLVGDARLVEVCEKIREIENSMAAMETSIKAMRTEQPPEPPKCPSCGREVKDGPQFCPHCGERMAPSAAAAVPAPTAVTPPAPPRPSAAKQSPTTCPNCGRALRPKVVFCGGCGHKIAT